MKLNRLWLALLAWFCSHGATPDMHVTLAHGTETEAQTRDQLRRLLKTYDLSSWTWTLKLDLDTQSSDRSRRDPSQPPRSHLARSPPQG